jgi:DNA-binding transcriptional ArsR family regulator
MSVMPASANPKNSGRTQPAKARTARAERIHHPDVSSMDLATIMRTLGDPMRLQIVRLLGEEEEMLCGEVYERLGLPASTGSYHAKLLRQAGITRARAAGTQRLLSLRRDDLESRFPGLVALITAAD